MHTYLIEMLECPACHGSLEWTITERQDRRVEEANARCTQCAENYPVREGVGLFLTPDLPREDLWEEVESHLALHLKEHPEVERKLLDAPLKSLHPTDQLFRAMALEERGEYAKAKAAEDLANPMLYTPEYLACHESQIKYVIDHLSRLNSPIVDLASGRGYLVEEMARKLKRPIIATDFSPRILRHDRHMLEYFGLYEWVSLLAFDARRTPFKAGSVKIMTTNLGLPNIKNPGDLCHELRRVIDGTLLAISHFFPKEDQANTAAIQEAGSSTLLFKHSALEAFTAAGWQVELVNACRSKALPTPPGVILEGARVDGLPVAETVLEWGVLAAH